MLFLICDGCQFRTCDKNTICPTILGFWTVRKKTRCIYVIGITAWRWQREWSKHVAGLNEVIPLYIDSIYSLYCIYFSQHNCIIKALVKATCFDLKSHRQAKLRTVGVLYNVAVRIWDPRWLTMCAVIRTVYITWHIYYTIVPILGVKYVTRVSVLFPGTVVHCLGSWLLCPLWLYWISCNIGTIV